MAEPGREGGEEGRWLVLTAPETEPSSCRRAPIFHLLPPQASPLRRPLGHVRGSGESERTQTWTPGSIAAFLCSSGGPADSSGGPADLFKLENALCRAGDSERQ